MYRPLIITIDLTPLVNRPQPFIIVFDQHIPYRVGSTPLGKSWGYYTISETYAKKQPRVRGDLAHTQVVYSRLVGSGADSHIAGPFRRQYDIIFKELRL